MSFDIFDSRRDGKGIKGRIIGQKPTCIIVVYPWADTATTKLLDSQLGNDLDGFTSGHAAGNLAGGSRVKSTIDNDIVRCSINKSKNSSSGGFSFILKRGNSKDHGQSISDTQIDYLQVFTPGDWVAIYMKSDGKIDPSSSDSDSGLKMIGIVDNVRYIEIDDPSQGRPRLEYVITGRDFGKVFESDIYFNPLISASKDFSTTLGAKLLEDSIGASKTKAGQSPDQMIKTMLKFYLGGGLANSSKTSQQWYVPSQVASLFKTKSPEKQDLAGNSKVDLNSVPFYHVLNKEYIGLLNYSPDGKFISKSPLLGEIINILAPSSGSVWEALRGYGNTCLNEFIVDLKKTSIKGTVNGKPVYNMAPCLQFRQIPYSHSTASEPSIASTKNGNAINSLVTAKEKATFSHLPRHVIQSTDVKQKNIGKSDYERINAVVVTPGAFNKEPIVEAFRMVINTPSVERYGTKILNVQSSYGAGDQEFKSHAGKCVSLLCDWFMKAHLLYNGTIVATGTDEFVEIGQNLFIEDVKQLFHIEGISYIYEIEQSTAATTYNTEFQVSRGVRLIDGKTQFIDSSVRRDDVDNYSTVTSNTLENIRNNQDTTK